MFDIGFFELLVVALVGLFVIGPEKLPHTIKVVALWIGRIKRSIIDTRREIEEQLGADEIRRELHNEQVMRNWDKMKEVREELEAKINALGQLPATEPPPAVPPPVIVPAEPVASDETSGDSTVPPEASVAPATATEPLPSPAEPAKPSHT